jgi:hypothetical protein
MGTSKLDNLPRGTPPQMLPSTKSFCMWMCLSSKFVIDYDKSSPMVITKVYRPSDDFQ